ncbi:2-succinyl-6-hydroxy-2,4-cyclohexadiene-1-carboxylate synthase [Lentibacillus sediminis]|uniref:2-succinyl-6-hydroxy-2, 4-cyclohexadiene-1-carboxylate synthase n=1 Tax=Lentibacillus sediminis TaxID=1940529 RepID=UPI000C1BEC1C|nr:2-succinyl-6-hydroxy-2,4-cyclohexadiene-1-carboxylate synthase [Lentibacillus sediminis]
MYVSINDSMYWYEESGDGIPLVMLHGFTGSSRTWEDFSKTHGQGFRVITVDLPGHGKTQTPNGLTMEQCCRELGDLFKALNLDRFHLLGYSMGGRTALSFAMIYPGAIESLILESASPGLDDEQERLERQEKDEKLARKIEREGIPAFVEYWESIPLFSTQKALSQAVREQVREERMAQTEEGLAGSLRGMGTGAQPSWWESLPAFETPVLLLAGELDNKFARVNQQMAARFPNAELHTVQGAGHAIHVEKPQMFGKLVRGFIINE